MNVVLRRSSLGDVVLAGALTAALDDVVFVTAPAWVALAARLKGVREVVPWRDAAQVRDALASRPPGPVYDLQGSLASARLCHTLGRPWHRARKHTVRRLLRLARIPVSPRPAVASSYAAAAGVGPAPLPWIDLPRAPRDALALVPGAAWRAKRPRPETLIEVGRRWAGPVVVLGGPADRPACEAVAAQVPGAVSVVESGFEGALSWLGRARVVVGGDTGLVHLGVAAGARAVVLFGPTSPSDGFFGAGGAQVIGGRTACSPCTRHGRDRCPRGGAPCVDHAAERVWDEVIACAG